MIRRAGWLSAVLTAYLGAVAGLAAEPYQVGDVFQPPPGSDQHGKAFEVKSGDFRAVLFDTPGESGDAEPPKDPQWFDKNRALLLVNISGFSGFKRRIARGRMESKPFRILVVEDAVAAAKFPRQKGKFTVLRLDEKGAITQIQFAAPGKELQDLFAPDAR